MTHSHGRRYDFTACDVFQGQSDVVQCGRVASVKNTAVPEWLYWTLCVLAVLLVRAFSYKVAKFADPDAQSTADAKKQPPAYDITKTDAAVSAMCALICVLCAIPPATDAMVTHEELNVFVFVIAYIVGYILAHAFAVHSTDPPIYNMIAASIQLIIIRLYCGTHTPYNPVLLWAVSTRSIYKLRSNFSLTASCSILLDSVLLTLMCTYGFETHFAIIGIHFVAAFCTAELALEQTT